jgi:hypothetical protein
MKAELFKNPPFQDRVNFWCPGCECLHQVAVNGQRNSLGATWGWNGSFDSPTFSPSVKVTWEYGEGAERKAFCCHSFVNNGRIQFLPDSTHKLAGQTVDLPEIPETHRGTP